VLLLRRLPFGSFAKKYLPGAWPAIREFAMSIINFE